MQTLLLLTFSLCAAATDPDHDLDEQYHQTCLLQTGLRVGHDAEQSLGVSREGRRHGLQQLWQQVRSAFDERPVLTSDALLAGELGRVSLAALQDGLRDDALADQRSLDEAFGRMEALSGAVADYAAYAAQQVGNASSLHGLCRDRELQLLQSLRDCVRHAGQGMGTLGVSEPSEGLEDLTFEDEGSDGARRCQRAREELSLSRQACRVLQFELEWTACNVTNAALYSPTALGQEYRDAVDNYTALETEAHVEELLRDTDAALASLLGCVQGELRAAPGQPLSLEQLDRCGRESEAPLELRHQTPPPLATLPHLPCTEEFILEHYSGLPAETQLDACHTCEQIEQSSSGVKTAAEAWHRRQGPLPPAASLAIA